jgi:hypothetical protein
MKTLLLIFLVGCGGSTATRSAYTIEAANCVEHERAIVDRTGTTLAQDQADLTAERERCDAALRVIAQ